MALLICICCNWKDKASLSVCTDWDSCRNSLKELSQKFHWTMNIFLEVAFQLQSILKQQVEFVDDGMLVFWITVDSQKVMPSVFLFYDIESWTYVNLTELHYNLSECIDNFQYSLHVCQQSSSSFEQEHEFPARSCCSSSVTNVTCCTSSLA